MGLRFRSLVLEGNTATVEFVGAEGESKRFEFTVAEHGPIVAVSGEPEFNSQYRSTLYIGVDIPIEKLVILAYEIAKQSLPIGEELDALEATAAAEIAKRWNDATKGEPRKG